MWQISAAVWVNPKASAPFPHWLEEVEPLPAMPQMCPLAFGVALTVLHAINASPEIGGVAMTFEEEPLDVDGFSRWLSKEVKWKEEFLQEKEKGRPAWVEIPASWSCQEQRNLRQAGAAVSISVDRIFRFLPEIAYATAGIAAAQSNLLQENVIYLEIWADRVRAYTGRFVDGDFEVNQTFETLKLDFHQALQELAMQNLTVVQAEYHHRYWPNMWELKRSYCDAFRRGSTDLGFDYHVNVGSKKSVQGTFDKQVLDQKVNELERNLTRFIDTIIGRLVKPQDVTLVIDGGSSFCLPDNRLFRDFFPQQVVELHLPSGTSRRINAFDTQRTHWFLGEEQIQVESYDSPDLGLVICKVREEVALREEVEAKGLEKIMEEVCRKLGTFPELDREEKMERETMQTSLLQVLKDDFPLAHPRYNSCWSLEKPTVDDCRHDANQSNGQLTSVLKFKRIYKEILWHSRRSQGSQVLPRPPQCQGGLGHSMVLLEADNLVKPQGMTLVETILQFIRTSQYQCRQVHMEQPADTEPRYYAQVWVRAEDENLLRDCIKRLASQKMKKSNVKRLKLKYRTEVNNDYGDSPRTFDVDAM